LGPLDDLLKRNMDLYTKFSEWNLKFAGL
jgi:hypothetical protein